MTATGVLLFLSFFCVLIVLSCNEVVLAQRLVNVKAVIKQQPLAGYINGPLRTPAIIQIQKWLTDEVYPCSVTVTSTLYAQPRYGLSTSTVSMTGNTTVSSTTGEVMLDNIRISTAGSGYHLLLTIAATVEGTSLTWNTATSAFRVFGYENGTNATAANGTNVTEAPPTPRPPPPPTSRPPPPPSASIEIEVDLPASLPSCQVWPTQPKITLRNSTQLGRPIAPLDFTVSTSVIAPSGSPEAQLTGTGTATGTNGQLTYSGLGLCAVGSGYQLKHDVRFLETNRTVYSAAFTSTGDAPSATPTPATINADLTNAVLRVYRQPGSGVAGGVLNVQPILRLEHRLTGAIIVTSATANASLYIPTYFGTSTATTVGTTTTSSNTGVLTWSNLGVSAAGYGYHLKFDVTAGSRTFVTYSTAIYIRLATGAEAPGFDVPVAPSDEVDFPNGHPPSDSSSSPAAGGGEAASDSPAAQPQAPPVVPSGGGAPSGPTAGDSTPPSSPPSPPSPPSPTGLGEVGGEEKSSTPNSSPKTDSEKGGVTLSVGVLAVVLLTTVFILSAATFLVTRAYYRINANRSEKKKRSSYVPVPTEELPRRMTDLTPSAQRDLYTTEASPLEAGMEEMTQQIDTHVPSASVKSENETQEPTNPVTRHFPRSAPRTSTSTRRKTPRKLLDEFGTVEEDKGDEFFAEEVVEAEEDEEV